MTENNNKLQLPDSVRDILIELEMAYLLSQSEDVVEFALNFFQTQQRNRKCSLVHGNTDIWQESINKNEECDLFQKSKDRRNSGSAPPFDPAVSSPKSSLSSLDHVHPKSDSQRSMLTSIMKEILLFNESEQSELINVVNKMYSINIKANEVISYENTDNFYIIERGKFKKMVGGKMAVSYDNYGYFGEVALLFDTSTVKSIVVSETEGVLWVLNRSTFQQTLQKAAYRRRKMYEDLLSHVPIFAEMLTTFERMTLADALESKYYHPGEWLYKYGDPTNGCYLLVKGALSYIWHHEKGDEEIYYFEPPALIGAIELHNEIPRTVSAKVEKECEVGFLYLGVYKQLRNTIKDQIAEMAKNRRMEHLKNINFYRSVEQ